MFDKRKENKTENRMKLMNLVDFFGIIFVHEWYLYTLYIYLQHIIAIAIAGYINYYLLLEQKKSGKNKIIIEKSLTN